MSDVNAEFVPRIETDAPAEEIRAFLEKMEPWQQEIVFSNGLKTSDFGTREPFNPRPLFKIKTVAQRIPLHDLRGGVALDVGFNTAYNAMHLAQTYDMTVTGIDIFERYLEIGGYFSSLTGLDIEFEKASAEFFLRPGSYDLVLHFGTLYHLPNPLLSLENTFKNLRPGGYLGLETQCYTSADTTLCKFIYGAHGDKTNFFCFSRPVLETLLAKYGFEDIQLLWEHPSGGVSEDCTRVIYTAKKPGGSRD